MTDLELLSAYLDGELPDGEALKLEVRLAAEPALANQLATMSGDDALVRASFADILDEPMPDHFLKTIDAGFAAKPSATVIDQASHRAANDNKLWSRWMPAGAAIAATLVAGLFVSTQLDDPKGSADPVAIALATTPSGQSISLASGGTLSPRLSFAAKDGGFCRQFTIASGDKAELGLACTAGGEWKVEKRLPITAGAPDQDSGYATVEGPDAAIEAMIDERRSGDPLSPEAELAAIRRGWKR
jgi:hypothetical protein